MNVIFFLSNSVQACMTSSLYRAYTPPSTPYSLFIKNRVISLQSNFVSAQTAQ